MRAERFEMTQKTLDGKVALVTGGSRGIGAAIAEGLAREGASVAITHAAEGSADRTVQHILESGGRAIAKRVDSRDRPAVRAAVDEIRSELGDIDILVNNAGVMQRMAFLDTTDEALRDMFAVNVEGLFVFGQEVARSMVAAGHGGSIVTITSAAQKQVAPNMTAYSVSKAAAFTLTRHMAFELGPHGIRVNCVAPGLTETDINRKDLADEDFRRQRLERIPVGFIGEPHDQIGAVVYLVSDAARYVTGACIDVDGGVNLTGPSAMVLR